MSVDDELPTIVYVDENDDAREDFYIDATRSRLFKDVIILPPSAELNEMINELLGREFEALITDFRLADAGPVNYDGSVLVERFLEVRSGFPCFIRTSYDDEAVATAADVNRVYSKESKGQETLIERSSNEWASRSLDNVIRSQLGPMSSRPWWLTA